MLDYGWKERRIFLKRKVNWREVWGAIALLASWFLLIYLFPNAVPF